MIVRYKGRIYRIVKGQFEISEHAGDRAWFAVKAMDGGMSAEAAISASHKWCNEKHLGMVYEPQNPNE
jgi:hypothetical protein